MSARAFQLSHAAADCHAGATRIVLSLFGGAGLLDRGFEQAGFCVLRGPDLLFGQRIEDFHAWHLHGHIEGVVGGSPCQDFSRARREPETGAGREMMRQFARCVTQAGPAWWLLENVPNVPALEVHGYEVQRIYASAHEFGSTQRRERVFQFGHRGDDELVVLRRSLSRPGPWAKTVTTKHTHRNFADLCELQGLPRGFTISGLSRSQKIRAVCNGVPVPMASAIADAIRDRAVRSRWLAVCGLTLCACGCGRVCDPSNFGQRAGSVACRKRIERTRRLGPSVNGRVTFNAGTEAAFAFARDATRRQNQAHNGTGSNGVGPAAGDC